MSFLIRKLAPLALIVIGVILVATAGATALGGGETEPTATGLADISTDKAAPKWIEVSDGGLYLDNVVSFWEQRDGENEEMNKHFYVRVLTKPQAAANSVQALLGKSGKTPNPMLVVKYTEEDFKAMFPKVDDKDFAFEDFFKATTVKGTKQTGSLDAKLRGLMQSGWGVSPDDVVLIQHGKEPLQQGGAIVMLLLGLALAGGGSFWIYKRMESKRAMKQPANDRFGADMEPVD